MLFACTRLADSAVDANANAAAGASLATATEGAASLQTASEDLLAALTPLLDLQSCMDYASAQCDQMLSEWPGLLRDEQDLHGLQPHLDGLQHETSGVIMGRGDGDSGVALQPICPSEYRSL